MKKLGKKRMTRKQREMQEMEYILSYYDEMRNRMEDEEDPGEVGLEMPEELDRSLRKSIKTYYRKKRRKERCRKICRLTVFACICAVLGFLIGQCVEIEIEMDDLPEIGE